MVQPTDYGRGSTEQSMSLPEQNPGLTSEGGTVNIPSRDGDVTEADMGVLMDALLTSKQVADTLVKKIDGTVRKCMLKVDKRIEGCVGKIFACIASATNSADAFSQGVLDTVNSYCAGAIASADELAAPVAAKLEAAGYSVGSDSLFSPKTASASLPTPIASVPPVPVPGSAPPAAAPPVNPGSTIGLCPYSFEKPLPTFGSSPLFPPVPTKSCGNGVGGPPDGNNYWTLFSANGCVQAIVVTSPGGYDAGSILAAYPGGWVNGPLNSNSFYSDPFADYAPPCISLLGPKPGEPPVSPPISCPPCPQPPTPPPCPIPPPCPPCPTPEKPRYNLWRRCKPKPDSPDCYCLVYTFPANDPGDQWLGQFETEADCEAAAGAACNACDALKKLDACDGADFKWLNCDESAPTMDKYYVALGYDPPEELSSKTPVQIVHDTITAVMSSGGPLPSDPTDPYA